jgi:putative transposase
VKRGLVSEPLDWRWSSFRHYATGESGTVEIESFWTAEMREKTKMKVEGIRGNKKP